MKRMQANRWVKLGCIVVTLSACEPMVDQRGHISETSLKEKVFVSSTTKDEVQREFGSPSSKSSFGDETWYYIRTRKESQAFFKPEIVSQQVTQIVFDEAGTVASVKEYDLKDGKPVTIVSQTTPTEGHSLGFVEQLIGNLGRFNKPMDRKAGMRPPGR